MRITALPTFALPRPGDLGLASPSGERRENLYSRWCRWRLNHFRAYRRTGARVEFVAEDLTYVRVRLPLNRTTRNHQNTIFGGALYGAIDPVHVAMLMEKMGKSQVWVWTRSAKIKFLRPGRETLWAEFEISPEKYEDIDRDVARRGRADVTFSGRIVSASGKLHARYEISIHVREKAGREGGL